MKQINGHIQTNSKVEIPWYFNTRCASENRWLIEQGLWLDPQNDIKKCSRTFLHSSLLSREDSVLIAVAVQPYIKSSLCMCSTGWKHTTSRSFTNLTFRRNDIVVTFSPAYQQPLIPSLSPPPEPRWPIWINWHRNCLSWNGRRYGVQVWHRKDPISSKVRVFQMQLYGVEAARRSSIVLVTRLSSAFAKTQQEAQSMLYPKNFLQFSEMILYSSKGSRSRQISCNFGHW